MPLLDSQFIVQMRQELQTLKEKTLKELADITDSKSADPKEWKARFPNRGDADDENAQEVAVFSGRLSLEKTLKDTLKDTEQALENINKGDYGICKHCEKPISQARLKARPISSSCIDCKKKLKGEE